MSTKPCLLVVHSLAEATHKKGQIDMKRTIAVALLTGLISYLWHVRPSGPSTAEIITRPYSTLENKTQVDELLLDTDRHTSWQFPLAVLGYLDENEDSRTIPVSGWEELLNMSAKTDMGQVFLHAYDLDQVVLMRDTLKYYKVERVNEPTVQKQGYIEHIQGIIDRYFGPETANTEYKSIPLSPEDFNLDTDAHISKLPVKQQHFLTDDIEEYRYFKEGSLLGVRGLAHYELRFFEGKMIPFDRVAVLHRIARAWARFTQQAGIHTWIAHGSLLGYYFNGLILPWDDDLDVQVTARTFWKLVEHNQTVVMDFNDAEAVGSYLIDVNPWFVRRERNPDNKIDARFIDLETGLYIDITTLTSELLPNEVMDQLDEQETEEFYKVFNPYHEPSVITESEVYEQEIKETVDESVAKRSLISCKDLHFYTAEELTPLIPTVFEGEILYIPNNINNMLLREYSRKSLYLLDYKGFTYNKVAKTWTHPTITSEYNEQMAEYIEHHYKIKQSTFKRHVFEAENLVRFSNFKLDPQIKNLTVA